MSNVDTVNVLSEVREKLQKVATYSRESKDVRNDCVEILTKALIEQAKAQEKKL